MTLLGDPLVDLVARLPHKAGVSGRLFHDLRRTAICTDRLISRTEPAQSRNPVAERGRRKGSSLAEACGNRTHRGMLSHTANGFEVRARHQPRFASARESKFTRSDNELSRARRGAFGNLVDRARGDLISCAPRGSDFRSSTRHATKTCERQADRARASSRASIQWVKKQDRGRARRRDVRFESGDDGDQKRLQR